MDRTFEIGDKRFRFDRLSLDDGMKMAKPLSQSILPVLTAFLDELELDDAAVPQGAPDDEGGAAEPVERDISPEALGRALNSIPEIFEQLIAFKRVFFGYLYVEDELRPNGKEVWRCLKSDQVQAQAFTSDGGTNYAMVYEVLLRCIVLEYGSFLADAGRRLTSLMPESPWSSLIGSIGESGDASSTDG